MTALNGGQQGQTAVIGVDVGGTTITVLVVDAALQPRAQFTGATDKRTPQHTLESIQTAVYQALSRSGFSLNQVSAIGIGIPGRVDPDAGVVHLAVNLNWDDMPAVPCFLENDLHLAALGYYTYFTNQSVQHMAYVSMGTGLAAGLILDGRLYRGAHGMAGEFGHMVVDPEGPRCNCGNHGCLEMYVAGPAIARAGQQAAAAGQMPVSIAVEDVTAVDVFQSARQGNPTAQTIINQVGAYMGRGLQALIMAFDIDKIILGGGIARAGDTLYQAILREWQRQARLSPLAAEMLIPEKIVIAPADINAGAWGGVALVRQNNLVSATPPLPISI
ncbi:MAG TPA: ROK family protein [Chloroflexota bacterium]|nr:ROK family protein [Chloroflexota bacterium]